MVDLYTKTVLAVIAAALVALVIQEAAPKAIAWYSNGHLEKYSLEAGRSAIEVAAVSV